MFTPLYIVTSGHCTVQPQSDLCPLSTSTGAAGVTCIAQRHHTTFFIQIVILLVQGLNLPNSVGCKGRRTLGLLFFLWHCLGYMFKANWKPKPVLLSYTLMWPYSSICCAENNGHTPSQVFHCFLSVDEGWGLSHSNFINKYSEAEKKFTVVRLLMDRAVLLSSVKMKMFVWPSCHSAGLGIEHEEVAGSTRCKP